jgi:hypothetical protein
VNEAEVSGRSTVAGAVQKMKCVGRCGATVEAAGMGRCSKCMADLERRAKREAREFCSLLRRYAKATGDTGAAEYAEFVEDDEKAMARGERSNGRAIPVHLLDWPAIRAWRDGQTAVAA